MLLTDNYYYHDKQPVLRLYKGDKLVYPIQDYPITLTIDNSKNSPTDQFYIPVWTSLTYDFVVDWGDGTVESRSGTGVSNFAHTYPVSNQLFNVYISGAGTTGFQRIYFNNDSVVKNKVTQVVINDDNQIDFLNSAFYGCSNLKRVTADKFPVLVGAYSAFRECTSLTEFPAISCPNVVGSFNLAWYNCTNLKTFKGLYAPNATNFSAAWYNCYSLTDFPAIDFPKATNFSYAWYNCVSLTDFPAIDFPVATNFTFAWNSCYSLTDFSAISCPNATSFSWAWFYCYSLTAFPAIDFPVAIDFSYAWDSCYSLTDFPAINFPNATNFSNTWRSCYSLTTFPAIDFPVATNFSFAWYSCYSLTDFSAIDFPVATNFNSAWRDCYSLTDFSADNFPVATNFNSAWYNCTNLKTFKGLYAPKATSFSNTWRNCYSLTDFPAIDFPVATNFSNTWFYCRSLTAFPAIDFPVATNFSNTWAYCNSLTAFPAISCPNATSFNSAWQDCTSLTGFNFYNDTFKSMQDGTNCFAGVTLPTQTWSAILTSVSATNILLNRAFHGGNSKRNAAGTAAYNYLTSRGWSITDQGEEGPYAANVSLLMHMDGTNGSQTFIDSSSNNYTLIANGDAQISTAIADPFGGSTSLFDSNDDYVEVPVDAGEFGSGDFTIECWIYANTTFDVDTVISKGVLATVDNKAWTLEWSGGRLAFFGYGEVSTGIVRTNNTLNTGTWYHVAVVKDGSNFRMYLDGVNQTDHSGNPTINTLDTGGVLLVGSGFFSPVSRSWDGYIDELRITKGVARYTSNFTPPTSPYTNP